MKKIVIFLFLLFLGIWPLFIVHWDMQRSIFIDLDEDYAYTTELDYLYEKGIIFPDENNFFNPEVPMKRGELISQSMRLSCDSCIPYEVSPRIVSSYSENQSFFDLEPNDTMFYCAEEADKKNYLLRLAPSYSCENGDAQEGESPFCADDLISRQDAIRAILNISWIYTQRDYEQDIWLLERGEIETQLWADVFSKNDDGTINPYFLYLRKALSLSIEERDLFWELIEYEFFKMDEADLLAPQLFLTREEFIQMAYVASKLSPCDESSWDFAALIDVYPWKCNPGETCGKEALKENTQTYDLVANYAWICEQWIDEEKAIVWRAYHPETNSLELYYGPYVDNAVFSKDWEWLLYLSIYDNCGRESTAKTTIVSWLNQETKTLSIEANPTNIILWNELTLRALSPDSEDAQYLWDFWDYSSDVWSTQTHTYEEVGTYYVRVQKWQTEAYIHVNVYESDLDFWALIDIFPASCKPWEPCNKADLTIPAQSYDFYANYAWVCEDGIVEEQIEWKFTNTDTGKIETRTWSYVDNFDFLEPWLWKIALTVVDACGKRAQAQSYLRIGDVTQDGWASLWIEASANNINLNESGKIDFRALSSLPEDSEFIWDFWDGTTGSWVNTSHSYTAPGTYTVQLESGWYTAFVTIHVYEEELSDKDSDGDGIIDSEDACVNLPWVAENRGCPILPWDRDGDGVLDDEDNCPSTAWSKANNWCPEDGGIISLCWWENGGCSEGYICSIDPSWAGEWVCLIDDVCALNLDGASRGNIVCNTCPCNYSLDFNSTLKICDIVFPAITSPDGTRIYSKGEAYQILD